MATVPTAEAKSTAKVDAGDGLQILRARIAAPLALLRQAADLADKAGAPTDCDCAVADLSDRARVALDGLGAALADVDRTRGCAEA